jgi:putative FmdB family regulatory protein
MPIYEYGCDAGHRFEVTQKLSDPPLTTCQVCKLPVSKLISAPAISFKGSGWYVTDYSTKLKPPAENEKTAKPSDSKKGGGEKPASTPPATTPPAGGGGSGPVPPPASSSQF